MVSYNRSDRVILHVFNELALNLNPIYTYHALSHTTMVMRDAAFLSNKLGVIDGDFELLRVAISMHDYGFVWSHENHEERSCMAAKNLLPTFGFSALEIQTICGMIMATKIPQSPKNLLEQIICDADLYYLGTTYYSQIAQLFQNELTALGILKNHAQWLEIQIRFLENHTYHTAVAITLLDAQKRHNLSLLKSSN